MKDDVEFDRIAPIYDETRQPPSQEELDTLVHLLADSRTVLDAGVGTGRFAVPLQAHGFEIVGVDLSLGMMRHARAKGVSTLLRANVLRLPLADRTVDAAFMSHVLQLLPNAGAALRELGRVARRTVVVQLPEWFEGPPTEAWRERRARYRELAAELGYPLPERGNRYWHTLDELSEIASPRAVQVVTRPAPAEGFPEDRLSRWRAQLIGGGLLPVEVHEEIVRRLRKEFPVDRSMRMRPRTTRFVSWDPSRLTVHA